MTALEGIRVLDLAQLAPGPFCTMMLGDLGADVLLVEQVPETDEKPNVRAAAHLSLSRNKRSMRLDLKQSEGLSIFKKLACETDVVLEGFRPGVVKRLGVDYDALAALNDRIVYCSLSGYGQSGPYAQMAGHDINYASIAGVLGMTGRAGQPPSIPMNFLADYAGGGLMAAFAIVAALLSRERTGRGQYIDMAMSDGALSLATKLAGLYFESGGYPQAGTHRLNGGKPYYDVYRCSDSRYVAVGPLEPKFWRNLCNALGHPELAEHQLDESKDDEIRAAFQARFLQKSRDEWFTELGGADACVTPVLDLDEALQDRHNLHRSMLVEVDHPELGRVKMVGVAPKLSGTPGSVRTPPPVAGEHTEAVLTELGYTARDIERLRTERVVA